MKNTNWLDEALEDLQIFRLKHYIWTNDESVWQKWLREDMV